MLNLKDYYLTDPDEIRYYKRNRIDYTHIPMVMTIMNTEDYGYTYDYQVNENNLNSYLDTVKKLVHKYPNLQYPFLAAISEIFLGKRSPAVYQFATKSEPAKKLINLMASLLYDRIFEYKSQPEKYYKKEMIKGSRVTDIFTDNHVYLLDNWDLSKISLNTFFKNQFFPTSLQKPELIKTSNNVAMTTGYPYHVFISTYSEPFTIVENGGLYPFYENILYVNTTYGDDQDLMKDYEMLLAESRNKGYGFLINDIMCDKLRDAGKMKTYIPHNDELKEYMDETAINDSKFALFVGTYIIPLISAAKAVNEIWDFNIDINKLEEFLIRCIYFYNRKNGEFYNGLTTFIHYIINNEDICSEDVEVVKYSKSASQVEAWLTHEIILTEMALNKYARKAFESQMGKTKAKKMIPECLKVWKNVGFMKNTSLQSLNKDEVFIISVYDYDLTI